MGLERIKGCTLEEIIGFIARENRVQEIQLLFYKVRPRSKNQEDEDGESGDLWTYQDRRPFTLELSDKRLGHSFEEMGRRLKKREEENIGLTSLVRLSDARICHIPMVDFCNHCSEEGLKEAMVALYSLGEERGFLVESGHSYHYYGVRLLKVDGWVDFMRSCQTKPVIGHRWPMLQLEDGFATLRISTSSFKPQLPRVIGKFGKFDFRRIGLF